MTANELERVIAEADRRIRGGESAMSQSEPIDVAQYRATLEVAYQLALLNESLGEVIGNRNPQIRVMVEPGEWPIQTQEQKR